MLKAKEDACIPKKIWRKKCVILDPQIWIKLPSKLVERILAHLPLPRLGQLRTLSKSWKWKILTKSFHKIRNEALQRSEPAFLVVQQSRPAKLSIAAALDPSTCKWAELSIPSSPPTDQGREVRATSISDSVEECICRERVRCLSAPRKCPIARETRIWISTDAGLVCVFYLNHSKWIMIRNPLLGCFREIPKPGMMNCLKKLLLFTLSVDKERNNFCIILVGTLDSLDSDSAVTEVYESSSGTWTVAGELPDRDWSRANFLQEGNSVHARLGSRLYFLVSTNADHYKALQIMSFELERRVWEVFPDLQIRNSETVRTTFFERKGSLILIRSTHGGQEHKSSNWWPDVYSWSPESHVKWTIIEISRPPIGKRSDLFGELRYNQYKCEEYGVKCVGKDDWILMYSIDGKCSDLLHEKGWLYNLTDKSWTMYSSYPYLQHSDLRVLPFEYSMRPLKTYWPRQT